MFNLQGSEIIVILLLALVVLGPEKLPDAIRKFSQTYGELKKMGTGFQSELKSALDEPLREMKETAQMVQDAADPQKIAAQADEDASQREEAEAADSAAVADVPVAAAALEVTDPAFVAGADDEADVADDDSANADTDRDDSLRPADVPVVEPADPDLEAVADGDDSPPVVINQIAAANARGPIVPEPSTTDLDVATDSATEAESGVEHAADADVAAG